MNKLRDALKTKKAKAAILAAFFTAFYQSLPIIEPYMPDWVFAALLFLSKVGAAVVGLGAV